MPGSRKNALYDYSGYNAYVLVNADELAVKTLMDDLSTSSVEAEHYMPSRTRAFNGRFYDYTIRLACEPGKHPDKQDVYAAIERWQNRATGSRPHQHPERKPSVSGPMPGEGIAPPTDPSEPLKQEVDQLKREVGRLKRENASLKQDVDSLAKKLEEENHLARSSDIVRDAFLMVDKAEAEKRALRDELDEAKWEKSHHAKLAQREMACQREEIVKRLFPDLDLLGGTVDVLIRELEQANAEAAMGFLLALQTGDAALIEKTIKGRDVKQLAGAPGWREMHVGRLYRLYYHADRRAVLIDMKKNQKKNIDNTLRRYLS